VYGVFVEGLEESSFGATMMAIPHDFRINVTALGVLIFVLAMGIG